MNLFWETVKMLVVLGLVLMAIVFVTRYGVARLQPGGMGRGGAIRVLERVPVGPKTSLLLVNVGAGQLPAWRLGRQGKFPGQGDPG